VLKVDGEVGNKKLYDPRPGARPPRPAWPPGSSGVRGPALGGHEVSDVSLTEDLLGVPPTNMLPTRAIRRDLLSAACAMTTWSGAHPTVLAGSGAVLADHAFTARQAFV
jgi:hypothetical protein